MDELPWLTLTDAAAVTGISRETLRSRARRDLLPSRRNNRGELLVQVPGATAAASPDHPDHPDHPDRPHLDDLLAEVADLRVALARAEAAVETAQRVAAAEVAAVRAELTALERYVARLERPFWRRWTG